MRPEVIVVSGHEYVALGKVLSTIQPKKDKALPTNPLAVLELAVFCQSSRHFALDDRRITETITVAISISQWRRTFSEDSCVSPA